jgi:hypothetical protein
MLQAAKILSSNETSEHADSHGRGRGDVDRLMKPVLEAAFSVI